MPRLIHEMTPVEHTQLMSQLGAMLADLLRPREGDFLVIVVDAQGKGHYASSLDTHCAAEVLRNVAGAIEPGVEAN